MHVAERCLFVKRVEIEELLVGWRLGELLYANLGGGKVITACRSPMTYSEESTRARFRPNYEVVSTQKCTGSRSHIVIRQAKRDQVDR